MSSVKINKEEDQELNEVQNSVSLIASKAKKKVKNFIEI